MASQGDGLLQDQSPYKATILPIKDEKFDHARRSSGSGKARQYAAAIILNLAALATGTVMGWPSPAGPILRNATLSPLDGDGDGVPEAVSAEDLSWLASVNFMAGTAGTLLFGALADRLGRRVAGLVLAVPFALSWVLVATTHSLPPLYAARLLGGVASAGTMVVCPLYVAETAQDEHRGALGTFLAVGVNAGILFTFSVSVVTDYRALPLVCLLVPAVFFLGLLRLPETPTYLVKRGRTAAARRALTWYRGGAASPEVDAELDALVSAAKCEESSSDTESAGLGDLFRHRGTRRALVQSLVLFANQQLSGVIAVLNYTETIFQEAGAAMSPTTSAIIVAAVLAICTYLGSFLIERAGRKMILVASNVLMAVCLITLGGCFYAKALGYDISVVGWLPVLAMSVYVVAFAVGLGPVPHVLAAETFAAKVRSLATAVGISVQTMSAFTCTKFFLNLQNLLGMHGCLWLFAAICLAGAVYTVVAVVETRGKTLDDILEEFHGDPTVTRRSTAAFEDNDGELQEAAGDDEVFHRSTNANGLQETQA